MMQQIIERLLKLLEVKSMMTLALTFSFVYLTIKGCLNAEQFTTIYTMIVAFYFGVQSTKG